MSVLELKRLLLADGPRQNINTITLYSYWIANGHRNPFKKLSVDYNGKDYLTAILLVAMVFTVVVFLGSLLLLIIVGILYIPLLCHIRGNLKNTVVTKLTSVSPNLSRRRLISVLNFRPNSRGKKPPATFRISRTRTVKLSLLFLNLLSLLFLWTTKSSMRIPRSSRILRVICMIIP
ncbi:hypothetical protein FRC03_003616 [Tulasnella sp. 419]|nr:hypothetical protein FRC03_003616 [Tulasnella sp. 419]